MSDTKKYSGEIIREAIKKELDKLSDFNCKISGNLQVGYNFEWDVYTEEANNIKTVSLLKFASLANNTNSSVYNFTFNFKKLYSIDAKSAFAKLFEKISNSENDCVNDQVISKFFFVLKNSNDYTVLCWQPSEKYYTDLMECSKSKTWTISVSKQQNRYLLKSTPYGRLEEEIILLDECYINLKDEDYDSAKESVKSRKYDISDWQRLFDRSFDKYWEYKLEGQKNDLNKNDCKSAYKEIFKEMLPKDKFNEKFFGKNSIRRCVYCGINEDQLSDICKQSKRSGRGERLEYDRIDDDEDEDYKLENVELACYWCNNAKTDEFSPNEFKEIARGISEVWKKRLLIKKDQYDLEGMGESSKWQIDFPDDSFIWKKNHSYSRDNFCKKLQDSEEDSDDN